MQDGRTTRNGGLFAGALGRSLGSEAERVRGPGSRAPPRRGGAPWPRDGREAPRARGARTRAQVPRPTTGSSRRSRAAPVSWRGCHPRDPVHIRAAARAIRREDARGVRAAGSQARAARRSLPREWVESRAPETPHRSTPLLRDLQRHRWQVAPRGTRLALRRQPWVRASAARPQPTEPRPPAP